MLDVYVTPITSQQQNTDDHDSPALELHVITAGLNGRCSAHKTNYCYSVFIHRTDLFIDVITRQLRLVLCINDYVRSSTIDSSVIFALELLIAAATNSFKGLGF